MTTKTYMLPSLKALIQHIIAVVLLRSLARTFVSITFQAPKLSNAVLTVVLLLAAIGSTDRF